MLRGLFPLALDEGKANPFAASLVLLVDVLNEGLEVGQGFIGHFRFLFLRFSRHGVDYSICLGAKPSIFPYPPAHKGSAPFIHPERR
jgi:hypothetical protein